MRLTPRRILTLEVIQRHWWLPSNYLFEFTKHLCDDMYGHRKDLKFLVDEGYLARPLSINDPRVKNDFLNYTLTQKGEELLERLGKRNRYCRRPGGGYAHAGLTVATTASLDLGITRAGFEFVSEEDILANAPDATKVLPNPLALTTHISHTFNGKSITSDADTIPDALCGIKYGDRYRFLAPEIDLASEVVEPKSGLKRSSILRKILSYDYILRKGDYKKQLNIPVLYPLFLTLSKRRAENMRDLAAKVIGSSNQMLFGYFPFSEKDLADYIPTDDGYNYFRSPPLLLDLFHQPFLRAGKEDFYLNKP